MNENLFKTQLKNLIEETKTSQTDLAKKIGVTRQAISSYTLGITLPDIEKFQKIADYFNVSYDYLLGVSPNKTRENTDIGERFGLHDKAIKNMEKNKSDIVDAFIESPNFETIIDTMTAFVKSDKNSFSVIAERDLPGEKEAIEWIKANGMDLVLKNQLNRMIENMANEMRDNYRKKQLESASVRKEIKDVLNGND